MSTESVQTLTDVLKKYLCNVVYIDDEFKVAWESPNQASITKPRRSSRIHSSIEAPIEPEKIDSEDKSKNSMEQFCAFVQKNFPQILLSPIKYSADTPKDNLINHLKNGKLIV